MWHRNILPMSLAQNGARREQFLNYMAVRAAPFALLIGLTGMTAFAQVYVQTQRSSEPGSFLGVFLQEISGDRAKALRLPEESGVEITRVDPNSPATAAGLMAGDVVLQYNGQRIEGIEQFSRMVRETPAGREVHLQMFRNGAPQTVTAKVGARPASAAPRPFTLQVPDGSLGKFDVLLRGATLGIQTESLTGQLADYFGVKEGVLVRQVGAHSAAERAGIKAGDVITRIGDAKVSTPADVTSQLRAQRGQSGSVQLMRDHREMSLMVLLEQNPTPNQLGPARQF
jgi:serine protease Do